MPFVFIIIGLLFLVVAIRGTQGDLFALLKSELWGPQSFIPWAAAILILGAIGYARPIKPIADSMIGLVLVVILLKNGGGFFGQLNDALKHPVSPATTPSAGPGTLASQPLMISGPDNPMPFAGNTPTLNPWLAPETLPATP